MERKMSWLNIVFWGGCLLTSILLQVWTGNFPFSFFAFPLNVLVAGLWLVALWIGYKDYRQSVFVRFLLSPSMTVSSLTAFLSGVLVIGFFPQLSAFEAASRTGIWARLGCYDFMSSWIFVVILVILLTHLCLVTYRGAMRKRKYRWRFVANHMGIGLALFAGFFGSPDTHVLRIPLVEGEPGTRAFTLEGKVVYLDYELELLDFHSSYYENGMPRDFEAHVRAGEDTLSLRVNHPYTYRWGEDLYLTGYERSRGGQTYCVLQVVKQPWKYVQLAGILMALAGGILLFTGGPVKKKRENDVDNLG